MSNTVNKNVFYAIQFLKLPFEGIDDHVCVPSSWIILRRASDQKVYVAYPNDEDPSETRDRAKRKEMYSDNWLFYPANIKHEFQSYEEAEYWTLTRSDCHKPCDKEEFEKGGRELGNHPNKKIACKHIRQEYTHCLFLLRKYSQPKPVWDSKLRSYMQHQWSSSITNKPQLTKKPYENPRKPMVKISIKRPTLPKPPAKLDNKRLKLDEAAKFTNAANYDTMASECSEKEPPIIIMDNQLISYAQSMSVTTVSRSEISTGQRTLTKLTQENKSAVISFQSTASKLPYEKQPSPICQDREQVLSVPVLNVVECNDVVDVHQEVQPEITEERPYNNQTSANAINPSLLPESANNRSTSLFSEKNQPQEPSKEKTSASQSNGSNGHSQKSQLHQILTAPTPVKEPSNAVNELSQLHQHTQSQFQQDGESSYFNPRPRETDVGKSTEVTHDNQKPHSQGLTTKPSSCHHIPKLVRISPKLSTSRKPSSSVIKNHVEKKTCQENITRCISTAAQHSSNPSSQPTCSVNKQARPPCQNPLQDLPEPVNHARKLIIENDVEQRRLLQGNTNSIKAAQHLSNLTYHSRLIVEQSHELQRLPTQNDNLQQIAHVSDLLKRPNIARSVDQRASLRQSNMINGGFISQNQANSMNQPSQFSPQPENKFLPFDRDHLQQVPRPELLGEPIKGINTAHRLNSLNFGTNMPFAAQTSSNLQILSHQNVSRESANHARKHIGGNYVDQRLLLQGNIDNPSAAQNLSNLAYQSRHPVNQSQERQHLRTQIDYLQQIANEPDLLKSPNIAPSYDQRAYLHQSMINKRFFGQNQTNLINQPSQFLPQPVNQVLPFDRDHLQQVPRPTLLEEPIQENNTVHILKSPNVGINVPLPAQNLSNVPNQSHQNVEYFQQRQNPPSYQDPKPNRPTAKRQFDTSFNYKSNNQTLEPLTVTKRTHPSSLLNISNPIRESSAHRNYLLYDSRIQRPNQHSAVHHGNLAAVPQKIMVEPLPTMQDSEVQTTSSEPSQETQFTLIPESNVYQHPRTKKLVVDQFTTMDFNMDCDHCDETVRSDVTGSSQTVVDSECQTDDYLMEETLSPDQEVSSDHETIPDNEIVSNQEEVSDNEICTNVPPLDMNKCTEENPSQNKKEERQISVQNFTPENQQVHPRIVAEQQMLNLFATLFTQMGANMSYTCEMFNNFRISILESAKTYQSLVETVQAFNSMGNSQTTMSPFNNVTVELPQVPKERPAGESERASSGNEDDNKNHPRRTFVLPPEHRPNDTKWTLKYQKKMPGLVELIPQSGIYVNSLALKRCKKQSKDCKMLARLLLTEVFSKNALSVCSLTGGKAKASSAVNIDVRPGLDEHARMVLLAYVEKHGSKRKWNTSDTQSIISSIRSKILEMRAKYGQFAKC